MDQLPHSYGPPFPFKQEVVIRHPCYNHPDTRLLTLPVPAGSLGTDWDVAMDACCIITRCSRSGGHFVFKDGNGEYQGAFRPDDGLLRPGPEYLFVISGTDYEHNYEVIPSFEHWRFPHSGLPPHWEELRVLDGAPVGMARPVDATVAMAFDQTCRITGGAGDARETAYIVPAAERDWFVDNDMKRYCRKPVSASPIDDDTNRIMVRRDLRGFFDGQAWALVPGMRHRRWYPRTHWERVPEEEEGSRSGPGGVDGKASVVSLVLQGSTEMAHLYHGRDLLVTQGLSVEFLYARFAWCVFQAYAEQFYHPYDPNQMYKLQLWSPLRPSFNPWNITDCLRGLVFRFGRLYGPREGDIDRHGCNDELMWVDWSDGDEDATDYDPVDDDYDEDSDDDEEGSDEDDENAADGILELSGDFDLMEEVVYHASRSSSPESVSAASMTSAGDWADD
ncbi:hypothetical protein MAPG_10585 [Magnaporthiopsis poae ATCC 64411]|uniref:HNH nuclease domain-containing protein n=1 Tax=Magnaporthiopsis poae (strain ATCC 64411 / 73-15) TaxID=644358 RepID=A0A0C4ECZ6_MAGP6|nr:hypothetical protein MAPG_10585 [Magnaporthiopsis poae ATCC 64411]